MNTQQQTAVVVQHLDVIAAKARKGLRKVTEGEDTTMEGWLEYGAALNEGREQFPSDDRGFGHWLTSSNLAEVHPADQAAALWAAANPQAFLETKKANPRVRTVRGLHAKWKAKDKVEVKLEPTTEDLETITKLKTLAERGATEGERESAKAKRDRAPLFDACTSIREVLDLGKNAG